MPSVDAVGFTPPNGVPLLPGGALLKPLSMRTQVRFQDFEIVLAATGYRTDAPTNCGNPCCRSHVRVLVVVGETQVQGPRRIAQRGAELTAS